MTVGFVLFSCHWLQSFYASRDSTFHREMDRFCPIYYKIFHHQKGFLGSGQPGSAISSLLKVWSTWHRSQLCLGPAEMWQWQRTEQQMDKCPARTCLTPAAPHTSKPRTWESAQNPNVPSPSKAVFTSKWVAWHGLSKIIWNILLYVQWKKSSPHPSATAVKQCARSKRSNLNPLLTLPEPPRPFSAPKPAGFYFQIQLLFNIFNWTC